MEVLRSKVYAAWSAVTARPVVAPLLIAFVVRAATALVISTTAGFVFPDESQYVTLGRLAASGHLTSSYVVNGQTGRSLFREAASFMWPLTALFRAFGPHILVAALWAAVFGAVTAAIVSLLVARALAPQWGALAGTVVGLWPSQVLWSSVVLRESMVWAGLAAAALGVALLARATAATSVVVAAVILVVALVTLAYLRDWVFLPAAWSAAISVWMFRPARPVPVRVG
ncbi:MAG TPA: hypothetical protein VK425_02525, partial [Acidimicrobiales bacterium]|nr:hypothetical protein [Acidimicrobiales bacterium]